MNVGLFGGSFDPPHVAHLIVAETVRERFRLDEVWWMPAHAPPHKESSALTDAAHRLAMTRRATASNPAFRVRSDEVDRGGASYTVDTLRALHERHPDVRFSLILGGDSLAGFSSWREPEEIARRAELLVYPRRAEGASPREADRREADGRDARDRLPPALARRVRLADAPLLEISATALRQRRRRGASLRYLVPDAVRQYIGAHDLYMTSPSSSEPEAS